MANNSTYAIWNQYKKIEIRRSGCQDLIILKAANIRSPPVFTPRSPPVFLPVAPLFSYP